MISLSERNRFLKMTKELRKAGYFLDISIKTKSHTDYSQTRVYDNKKKQCYLGRFDELGNLIDTHQDEKYTRILKKFNN